MAGNSTVKIFIQGDAGGVSRAARDAERSLSRLHGRASTAFRGMSEVAGGFGLAMGAAGVLGAVQQSVQAYQESEKSGARMAAQLDTIGKNTATVTSQIQKAIAAQSEFGAFDDEDLQDSFTKLVRATGDVNEALKLNGLVMDIARGKGVDLATASDAVAKAAAGNTGALRRMGIQVEKGASAQEALAAAQDKFAGQAKKYGETNAAEADRASIAWENAQEAFGEKAAQAFSIGAQGARRMADSLDDVVDAAGGLQGLAAGGGAFLAVSKLGPATLSAANGFQAMRREIEMTSRIKAGEFDVFHIANQKIDTRATQKNIRAAYREIGQTISTAQATALAKGERIAAPLGRLGTIPGMARRAGASLVSLAGGPMGVAAIAAGGLVLGIAKAAHEMTTMGEEADDVTNALQRLADAQLALKDAAFGVKQAQVDANNAPYAVTEATQAYHDSIIAADTALRRFGEDSKQYAQAQDAVVIAGQQLQSAQLLAEQATLRLEAALRGVDLAKADVAATAGDLQQQIGGLIEPSRKLGAQMTLDALHAGDFAAMSKQAGFQAVALAENLRKSAASSDTLSASTRAAEMQMADLIQTMGRVPTPPEIEFITNALAVGQSIDQIRQEIENVPKNTTVTINQVINRIGSWFTPPTSATGSAIAGTFDGKDNVPVMVSRGEVILNPQQIGMIGPHRVYGALRATGAPTIVPGGGYAGGGTTDKKKPTRAEIWDSRLDRSQSAYSLRFNQLDSSLAAAEQTVPRDRDGDGTISPAEQARAYRDDNVARRKIQHLIRARLRQLRRYLAQKPTRAARERIYGEIASLTRDYANYAELKPDPVNTSGGGSDDSGGTDTADLEARLRQAEARAAGAERNLGLSEAELRVFGGAGYGAGRATQAPVVVQQFHSIFPPTPDQFRSGAAFMSDAFGRQPFRRTPRIRIGA